MEQTEVGRLRETAVRFKQEPRIRAVVLVDLFYLGRSIDQQGRVAIGSDTRRALVSFANDLVRLGLSGAIKSNCDKSDPDGIFVSEMGSEPELDELATFRNQMLLVVDRLEEINESGNSNSILMSEVAGLAIDVAFGIIRDDLEDE